MKKYELREKINTLEMLGQEIARASAQIEKACKLLENVYAYLDFITK